jgi:uncharacterized damage-inducible protein DinB
VSLVFRVEELLDYSDHERGKWRQWIAADPSRLQLPFQSGGRFPTLGSMLDHTFLVERRHLARLEGATPPDSTGINPADGEALFDYADLVRADLRTYVADLDDTRALETLTFTPLTGGTVSMTRRKLVMHIVVHELRHLAQIALAGRMAGQEPPGRHDFFYYPD